MLTLIVTCNMFIVDCLCSEGGRKLDYINYTNGAHANNYNNDYSNRYSNYSNYDKVRGWPKKGRVVTGTVIIVIIVVVVLFTKGNTCGRLGNRNTYYKNNDGPRVPGGGLSKAGLNRGAVGVANVRYRGYITDIAETVGHVSNTTTGMDLGGNRTIISCSERVSGRRLGGMIRSEKCRMISVRWDFVVEVALPQLLDQRVERRASQQGTWGCFTLRPFFMWGIKITVSSLVCAVMWWG